MSVVESGRARGEFFVRIFGQRWGFEFSPITHMGDEYMARWIIYVAGCTLRLHRFARGDERGPTGLHNHPFWFVTFPLHTYREEYWKPCVWCGGEDGHGRPVSCGGGQILTRTVRRFRFHFRGHSFRHRVCALARVPVWTIVLSGRYTQQWGFFPDGSDDSFYPLKPKAGTTDHDATQNDVAHG